MIVPEIFRDFSSSTHGEKDVAMSTELLNTLENRVMSAVGTIEDLRTELRVLKEERQVLENKLRDLLSRMDQVESATGSPASLIETPEASSGFQKPSDNGGSFGSEY